MKRNIFSHAGTCADESRYEGKKKAQEQIICHEKRSKNGEKDERITESGIRSARSEREE